MRTTIILGVALLILCGSVSAASDAAKIAFAKQLAAGYIPGGLRSASGEGALTIESKTVQPGESTRIGIYIRNDVSLWAMVVPLVIRSIDSGSFWAEAKPKFDHTARINGYLDGTYEGEVIWPEIVNTYPVFDNNPPRPFDYSSPDYLLMVKGRITEGDLPPGDDGTPDSGRPSIVIDITVNDVPGRFEIDTTIVMPGNHLIFVGSDADPRAMTGFLVPDFTKGIITIAGTRSGSDGQDTTVVPQEPPDTLASSPDPPTDGDTGHSVIVFPRSHDSPFGEHSSDSTKGMGSVVRTSSKGGMADTASQLNDPTWKGENHPSGSPGEDYAAQDKSACSNYPNPFNAGTVIRFVMEEPGDASLSVYNLLGQRIATLVDGQQAQGEHLAPWNGSDAHGTPVSSGIYLYRFQTAKRTSIGKMVLVR